MLSLQRGTMVLLACFATLSLWIGCSSEDASDGEEDDRTEVVRGTLDARVETFLLQGEEAFQSGSYERALALADSAEEYGSGVAVIYFFRGSIYTAMGRFNAAQEAYQRAIERDPEYPEAHLRMGDNAFQRGNHREAVRFYKKEEEIAPSSALYVKLGRAYAELGVADSARLAYEQAVAQDSTNADAHMMFGQFLEEVGEIEAALDHSRKALSLQPEHPNYQYAVGSQLYQIGELEEAAEHLKRAADERLLHYPAQYNLGQVLMRLNREDEANYYLARGDSARELMDQISSAQDAISRNPDDIEHWIRLGELYRAADAPDQALETLKRAASVEPENLSVQRNVAELLLANGNTKEAIRRFEAILDADPSRVDARLNLGRAYAEAGNCDEARRSWETVLKYRPDDFSAKEYLAEKCQ